MSINVDIRTYSKSQQGHTFIKMKLPFKKFDGVLSSNDIRLSWMTSSYYENANFFSVHISNFLPGIHHKNDVCAEKRSSVGKINHGLICVH